MEEVARQGELDLVEARAGVQRIVDAVFAGADDLPEAVRVALLINVLKVGVSAEATEVLAAMAITMLAQAQKDAAS